MLHQRPVLAVLLASSALALPELRARQSDSKQWDPNGNVKLVFSKDTISIGDIALDDILSKFPAICHEAGQCQTNDLTFDGFWYGESSPETPMEPIHLVISPDGEYPTWMRNGLVDAFTAAVKTVAVCEDKIVTSFPCDGCVPERITVHVCDVPKYWGINYQGAQNAAPPNIDASLEAHIGGEDACQKTWEDLSVIAGAINGVGGGVFTLLDFTCQIFGGT